MRKNVLRVLYGLFFVCTAALFIACALLLVHTFGTGRESSLGAVKINVNEETPSQYRRITEISLSPPEGTEETGEEYGYGSLADEAQRELYHLLSDAVMEIPEQPNDDGRYPTRRVRMEGMHLSEDGIRRALNGFLYDHPQVFWLENLFGYAYSGEDTLVECYSAVSASRCASCSQEMTEKIESYLRGVSRKESYYDKEKYIHDRLLSECRYNTSVTSNQDGWEYFSAYGAIVYGEAVCEGYSKAMQLLLTKAGFSCRTIRGTAGDVEHMWNLVKINGSWYQLDATWDDGEDAVSHEYFNLTTQAMQIDHQIYPLLPAEGTMEKANLFLPECRASAMNYYTVEGITVSSLGGDMDQYMIDYIVNRVKAGHEFLPLIISNRLAYQDTVERLFYQSPYKFYYYIDQANLLLPAERQIQRDHLRILRNEKTGTVRVRVSCG